MKYWKLYDENKTFIIDIIPSETKPNDNYEIATKEEYDKYSSNNGLISSALPDIVEIID